jgi:acyl-coenzyme A thioesterase PaaI-like protein
MTTLSAFAGARKLAREANDFSTLHTHLPYAAYLGLEAFWHQDQLRFRLPYRPELIGNSALPALHGGVIAGFMECSAQLHLLLSINEDRLPKSINFSLDYLRSGNPVDAYADCLLLHLGGRVAQVQIRCWQDAPRKADASQASATVREIAHARASFLLTAASD